MSESWFDLKTRRYQISLRSPCPELPCYNKILVILCPKTLSRSWSGSVKARLALTQPAYLLLGGLPRLRQLLGGIADISVSPRILHLHGYVCTDPTCHLGCLPACLVVWGAVSYFGVCCTPGWHFGHLSVTLKFALALQCLHWPHQVLPSWELDCLHDGRGTDGFFEACPTPGWQLCLGEKSLAFLRPAPFFVSTWRSALPLSALSALISSALGWQSGHLLCSVPQGGHLHTSLSPPISHFCLAGFGPLGYWRSTCFLYNLMFEAWYTLLLGHLFSKCTHLARNDSGFISSFSFVCTSQCYNLLWRILGILTRIHLYVNLNLGLRCKLYTQ